MSSANSTCTGPATRPERILRIDPRRPYVRPSIILTTPESSQPILPSTPSQASYLAELYVPLESELLHQVTLFKSRLRSIRDGPEFWRTIAKDLPNLLGAQFACISKRLDTIESNTGIPSIDEEGSCVQAVAWYNNCGSNATLHEDVQYTGFCAPCGLMRYNTTALIPHSLSQTFLDNPTQNNFVEPADAYLSVPMFDGKGSNVGHICLIWTKEGRENCPYSWAMMEFVLHVVVEMATQRFLEHIDGHAAFEKEDALAEEAVSAVKKTINLPAPGRERPNPLDAANIASLALPFPAAIAAKISHEIRTPLQGIIGLLEILYTQIDPQASPEATPPRIDSENNLSSRGTIQSIIEGIQANSNRLMAFADTLVEFYSLATDVAPQSFETSRVRLESLTRKRKLEEETDEEITWATDGAARKFLKRRKLDTKTTTEGDDSSSTDHNPRIHRSRQISIANQISIRSTIRQIMKHVFTRHEVAELWGGKKLGLMTHNPETRMRSILLGEGEQSLLLEWNVADDVPRWLHCGKTGFQKAIAQLLVNAIKFTPTGRVTLKVKKEARRLTPTKGSSDTVVFSIKDTGIGVAQQDQQYLAQPFFQVDTSMTRSRDGSGLGLVLTSRWATKMGGELRLEKSSTVADDPLRGSEFSLRLPVDKHIPVDDPQDSADELTESSKSRDVSSSSPANAKSRQMDTLAVANTAYDCHLATLYPFKIMVVEDNSILRRVLSQLLEKLGYKTSQIVLCSNGKEAVDYYLTRDPQDCDIDLILMDCWMPVMNGHDATQHILEMFPRNVKRYQGIKPDIVAITADNLPASLAKAESSGMRGYMVKPVKLNDLQRVVEECAEGNWIMNRLAS
jgi:signal transduction histidine kinase/AmiR/NasT family two-component response regulator